MRPWRSRRAPSRWSSPACSSCGPRAARCCCGPAWGGVLVHGKERPFGILGAHTTRRREFTIHDAHFLQAIANVLATAIDRARTEAALRSSEEHFRSLIENASDIVTVVGENGVFRYASPSVER